MEILSQAISQLRHNFLSSAHPFAVLQDPITLFVLFPKVGQLEHVHTILLLVIVQQVLLVFIGWRQIALQCAHGELGPDPVALTFARPPSSHVLVRRTLLSERSLITVELLRCIGATVGRIVQDVGIVSIETCSQSVIEVQSNTLQTGKIVVQGRVKSSAAQELVRRQKSVNAVCLGRIASGADQSVDAKTELTVLHAQAQVKPVKCIASRNQGGYIADSRSEHILECVLQNMIVVEESDVADADRSRQS